MSPIPYVYNPAGQSTWMTGSMQGDIMGMWGIPLGEPMSAGPRPPSSGSRRSYGSGSAIIVGAAFALFMGLSYTTRPTFTTAALPTIAGVAVAVVVFLVIGAWAPPNE